MTRALLALLLLVSSCVVGAPPGFSGGDNWSVPLVAPLENDLLMVPVSINGEGPYLFMIDTDSNVSGIDHALAQSLNLIIEQRPEELTEVDTRVPVNLAQAKKLTVGTLDIRNPQLRTIPNSPYTSNGRQIVGFLGRDVIADSLIVQIDRDAGMLYLATQGHASPPPGATSLEFDNFFFRKLADVTVNRGKTLKMHLDLGARNSMVWPRVMEELKLPSLSVRATLHDEYGARREVDKGAMAAMVSLGGHEANGILLLPFGDQRVEPRDFDGSIGQDVLSQYHVTVNWHAKTMWLKERPGDLYGTASARINRWELEGCVTPGCVKVEVLGGSPEPAQAAGAAAATPADGEAATPADGETAAPADGEAAAPADGEAAEPAEGEAVAPADGEATTPAQGAPSDSEAPGVSGPVELVVTRAEPGLQWEYEIMLEARGPEGSLGLPHLVVSMPAGVPEIRFANLDPAYARAEALVVLDINPVGVRQCQTATCVFSL